MDSVKQIIDFFLAFPLIEGYTRDFLGEKCFTSLLEQINLNDYDCLELGLSKALGAGIVVGGALVKLPQILNVLVAKSTKGLSFSSYLLETVAHLITLAYNVRSMNPFSTYGETFFVSAQNCIILVLMFAYKNQYVGMALLMTLLVIGNYAMYDSHMISSEWLQYLQASTIPVSVLSKIPQIVENYQNESTGTLSSFTVLMFFFGTLARVFTTWREVDDPLILWGFILAAFLNGVVLLQLIYYWNSGGKGSKKKVI